jgi:hypothetical protein
MISNGIRSKARERSRDCVRCIDSGVYISRPTCACSLYLENFKENNVFWELVINKMMFTLTSETWSLCVQQSSTWGNVLDLPFEYASIELTQNFI